MRWIWCSLLSLSAVILISCLLFAAGKPAKGVHPLVDAKQYRLFGGLIGQQWVDSDAMMKKLKGGECYQLYSPTRCFGTAIGSKPEEPEMGGDSPYCYVDIPESAQKEDVLIAVGGEWNALPRFPRAQSTTQKVYMDVVQELLTRKGLPDAKINITSIWRIDLEGDGTDEVLISATTDRKDYRQDSAVKRGDYSLVLLRKIINGKVVTIPIDLCYYTEDYTYEQMNASGKYPPIFSLCAVLDVNGDDIMEILVKHYYMTDDITVYQVDGATVKAVLCAASDV